MKNSKSTRKCNNLLDNFYNKNIKIKKTNILKPLSQQKIKIYLSKIKKGNKIKTEKKV
jgi:hypothetical protein